jgi:hypothetical protein
VQARQNVADDVQDVSKNDSHMKEIPSVPQDNPQDEEEMPDLAKMFEEQDGSKIESHMTPEDSKDTVKNAQHEEMVRCLIAVTGGEDENFARRFLQANRWNLEQSVNKLLEDGSGGGSIIQARAKEQGEGGVSVDTSKDLVFKRRSASPMVDRATAGITFTPAPMRTRDIIEKLRGYAPEVAKATYERMEKRELLALLERYQRANISNPLPKLETNSSPAAGVASSSFALSAPSSSGTGGKKHRQAIEAGVGESGVSGAEEREDSEVGLSHKDAEEQTFAEYVPHAFSDPVFHTHPDPVVETASLSSLVPPKTTHKLRLCAKTITQGLLTNLQLETINLACQQHELRLPLTGARGAFFMGDGPGVV